MTGARDEGTGMNFMRYDLGNVKAGSTVVVTLDKQAKRPLDGQRAVQQLQGWKAAQVLRRWSETVTGTDHGATDRPLGGGRRHRWAPGRVRVGVDVLAPPTGLLPEMRTARSTLASRIAVREPEDPAGDVLGGQTWDVFLSHASEDKAAVARPLRNALAALGVRVWLDEAQVRLGDSLRRKIDQGIRSSKFGVIVLSEAFFAKGWTNHELDGIVTRNVAGEQSMLPIWHGITAEQVRGYSPSLADKIALSTSNHSIEDIAQQIAQVVTGVAV